MVFAQLERRRATLASRSVARAFAYSLLFHALLFLTIETGYRTGLWNARLFLPSQRETLDPRVAQLLEKLRPPRPKEEEMPLVFVDVDPSLAATEAPPDAKYYSALNSKAANPDTTRDTLTPKVEGTQQNVPQTMDRGQPLQPTPEPPAPKPAPEPPKPEPKPEPEPQPPVVADEPPPDPSPRPGDLAMAKPAEKLREASERKPAEQPTPPRPPATRPRTLEAARRKAGLPGEKMKQQGGVRRFGLDSSFDVKSTPFGSYDAAIIAAIRQRWYDLLETRDFTANYSGRVVLEFRLNSDGRVTDMKVSENSVSEILGLLCQRAVQDPAPFLPWPADLRRLVGKDYREVRFTFYYN